MEETKKPEWQRLADIEEYGAAAKLWLSENIGDRPIFAYLEDSDGNRITKGRFISTEVPGDDGNMLTIAHALVAVARYCGYSK